MKRAALFLLLLLGLQMPLAAAHAQTSLPTGKGLPLQVNVAVEFIELISFKENAGTFVGTVDVRLRWEDLRHRQPADLWTQPPRVFRGAAADTEIAKIWVPPVEIANQRGRPTYASSGLWLYPDGRIELVKRITAEFSSPTDVERFPFDRQKLRLDVTVRDADADMVALVFNQSDLDDSRYSKKVSLDGWTLGNVTLRGQILNGWRGATHSQVVAALEIVRQPAMIVASVFVPLFASLLIPMLSLWLNRNEDGLFQIETFELVNIIIGGLFAVVALNFTIASTYEMLGSADNPVNRLLALNYLALAVGLAVNVLIFRFGVVRRSFGRYVEEQVYYVLAWAVPVVTFATAAAIVVSALA